MGLYNGKTTTTMPLLCSEPDSVDGKHQDFEQPVSLREFLKRKLTENEVYFSIHKRFSIHGNLITHMRASVMCCIHNIGHNNGIHTRAHTHTYMSAR